MPLSPRKTFFAGYLPPVWLVQYEGAGLAVTPTSVDHLASIAAAARPPFGLPSPRLPLLTVWRASGLIVERIHTLLRLFF